MTPWKRRMVERARQSYGLSMDRGFKPTANSRLHDTFTETKHFADALRKFDKQTTHHIKVLKEYNKNAASFLGTVLPRMHKETDTGQTEPVEEETIVGSHVDIEKVESSGDDGDAQIFKYVQEPLRKWLSNFETVVLAMQSVEQLRLMVDSRRRTLAQLEGQLTNAMAKQKTDDDPKVKKLIDRKHRQEMKLANVQEDFSRKELQTYQNMRHLVNDVKYVQQHIHKLFDLLRQINGDVCDAFPINNPLASDMRQSGAYLEESAEGPAFDAHGGLAKGERLGEMGALEREATKEPMEAFGANKNRMDGYDKGGRKVPVKHADRYGDTAPTASYQVV